MTKTLATISNVCFACLLIYHMGHSLTTYFTKYAAYLNTFAHISAEDFDRYVGTDLGVHLLASLFRLGGGVELIVSICFCYGFMYDIAKLSFMMLAIYNLSILSVSSLAVHFMRGNFSSANTSSHLLPQKLNLTANHISGLKYEMAFHLLATVLSIIGAIATKLNLDDSKQLRSKRTFPNAILFCNVAFNLSTACLLIVKNSRALFELYGFKSPPLHLLTPLGYNLSVVLSINIAIGHFAASVLLSTLKPTYISLLVCSLQQMILMFHNFTVTDFENVTVEDEADIASKELVVFNAYLAASCHFLFCAFNMVAKAITQNEVRPLAEQMKKQD